MCFISNIRKITLKCIFYNFDYVISFINKFSWGIQRGRKPKSEQLEILYALKS